MTKFEQKSFTEFYGSRAYAEGWDRIFGKKDEEEAPKLEDVKDENGHHELCNENHGGSCDCELIKQSKPEAKFKCSNCHFSTDGCEYPGKLICAYIGAPCPEDYYCENHRQKKGD